MKILPRLFQTGLNKRWFLDRVGVFNILSLILILFIPGFLQAQQLQGYVETTEFGQIDWYKGRVTAIGKATPPETSQMDEDAAQEVALRKARIQARANLLKVIQSVRIFDDLRVKQILETNKEKFSQLRGLVHNCLQLEMTSLPSNQVKIVAGLDLFDELSRILIPDNLWYQDPGSSDKNKEPSPSEEFTANATIRQELMHPGTTGVILDARGFDLDPALVCRICDDRGEIVYGPSFVNPYQALDKGMVVYVQDINSARASQRVGERPLQLRAAGAASSSKCDLQIYTDGAEKMRILARETNILKNCRLVIVLGPSDASQIEEYPLEQ